MKLFVGALVLWMYTTSAYGQDRCYFSRLDVLPCPSRPRAPDPEINEYGIYRTRIGFGKSALIECRRRGRGVVIRNITTLGAEEIRLLYSPGFELDPKEDYANQMLVIYNIQCKNDERIFFNITHQDIEPKNCTGAGGELVCADYVEVDRGIYGRTESCGTEMGMNTNQLEGQNMTVRFRTSEEIRFPGFEMIAICYKPEELNLPGCTLVDEEQSGNGSSTDHLGKRDLQEFHMWQHRLRRRARNITSKEIIVAFGDQVTYRDQQITVLRNNVTVALFRNIAVLQTLDAEGRHTNYTREARDKERQFIFFRGPGPMTITGRRAYFQLFVFDPRGIVPTEAEGRVIRKLTESQFSQLSPSDDVLVEDPDLTTDFPDIPIGRRKRRTSTIKNNRAFNVDAVQTSIMNENACNPVLKASARATLTVNNRIDARRVRQIRERLQMTTRPPTREATKPAVKTELTVETEAKVPTPATAPPTQTLPSLNCNVEIEDEVGALNCMVPAGMSHTTCFFDGMREERSLRCNEFPTRFRLEQFSKGKHNVTVEVSMTVTFEVP